MTEVILTKEQSSKLDWVEFKDEDFPFHTDKAIALRYEPKDEDQVRYENILGIALGLQPVTVDDTDFAYDLEEEMTPFPFKGPLVSYAYLTDDQVKELFK
jgi:hypothetical protein